MTRLGRLVPWVGVAAAALLLVNVNVLGARWYQRWDVTTDKLYSLSQPTRELLAGLQEPVDVNVLLSKSDPLTVSVRHMLEAYAAETRQLRVRYVDPDRSPAEFLAVQQKYQILAGKAEDGRVITDAVIVLAQGPKHWFITSDELVKLDEASGRARPALEGALSGALDNLRKAEKAKLCFTTGHREPTLEDAGPQGLSELRKRLEKSNYEPVSVDGSAPRPSYAPCVAVLVPTPELEFSAEQAKHLADYVRGGGSALLLLSPNLDESGRVRGSGLEPVLELSGVTLGRDLVLEQDKAERLPSGSGELFYAKLRPHALTRGVLHEDDKLSSRVLVAQARSVDASGGANVVMETTAAAVSLKDLSPLGAGQTGNAAAGAQQKVHAISAARELPKVQPQAPHGPRLFVTGASNLAWNRNFQDPSLYGNQRLIENAISWAAARPSMLNVPQKPEREVGLSLSEESLDEVQRYVLFYMPLSAGLLAAFVLLRRRNDERRARSASARESELGLRRQTVVNGALLALALGTLGVVWATRDAPTSAELTERKDKLWPSFRREKVRRLVLTKGSTRMELERGADELRITKPWSERADIATVQKLLTSLELASALRPADDVDPSRAGLGAEALSIRVEGQEKPLEIRLGGPAPAPLGARYARVEADGASRTYVVSQGVASELDIPFEKFRETRLLEHGRSELETIVITKGAERLELAQREHGAFFVRTGDAWQLASREAVDAVLTALARLSSEQLVDAEQARGALGPQPREVKLELFDKAAPPITLRFAAACPAAPEQALVLREQAGRGPRAGCIPSDVAGALALRTEDARLSGPFSARVDEIEELRVVRGSAKLELARKDKAFLLRGATNTDVPLDAGNERISAVLRARGAPSTAPVEPAGEVVIQISGADEATHREERVSVSKPRADGGVCLKRLADGVTMCVDAETARAFEPDTTLLRSLTVLRFAPSDLVSLRLEARGVTQKLIRRDDGSYDLTEPKGFGHDGALVANVVQTLGALEASRWVAAADEPRFGFASPRLRATFELTAGERPRELLVGAAAPGGYFAKTGGDPSVFVLPGSAFADLSAILVDRSLSPFAESDLERAELKVGPRPPKALSGPLLSSVAALRAEQTVHLGPRKPSEALDPPQLELSLTGKSGKTARVTVGSCDTLDDASICYARRDGVDATFGLSRRLVAELRDFAEDAP